MTSFRYSQEIANVICSLEKDKKSIEASLGKTGIKLVLLVFDMNTINRVICGFINALEIRGLCDNRGIYKAISTVRNENSSGLKIGSYWSEFDGSVRKQG